MGDEGVPSGAIVSTPNAPPSGSSAAPSASGGADLEYRGPPQKTIQLLAGEQVFDPSDPQIKSDIIRIIIQYLANEGYTASMMTIQDEANVSFKESQEKRALIKRMRKLILAGDWPELERICTKQNFKHFKVVLYAAYKQQFLELIEAQEYQKALSMLTKRLKPLESLQTHPNEFRDLAYLLTCKSVQDLPSFKGWDGVQHSREQLADQIQSMLDVESSTEISGAVRVPPSRLITLLQQAIAYQVEFSRYHPTVCPRIKTLLHEYECFVIPNALRQTLKGSKGNVKCVEFLGEEGRMIISGSSDNHVRLWNTESGECVRVLQGHSSRIWDVSSNKTGEYIASGSGDGTVRLWDVREGSKEECISVLTGHEGDVYTVRYHPSEKHVATGGYDKSVRLYDASRGTLVKTFSGAHQNSVTRIAFNPHGNWIISGSKDATIKVWDIVSGVCIRTYSSHLGEVTSVEMDSSGTKLLSSSKDNSNRLWDIRQTARPIQRFKGHQNTSTNFIRASFGPNDALVVGGSEDGHLFIWDLETSNVLQRLQGHNGPVYSATWSKAQSILASCGADCCVRTWWWKKGVA